jgi:hypothetical protein
MTADTEAAADALTGTVVASVVEPNTGSPATQQGGSEGTACPNCGAALTGAYCSSCGQAAHIHRSIVALGHDILHSVFHFEGKLWRTLPELVINPGRLTRRYVQGQRAKYVSPMALYLFTVFLMYAVSSLTGASLGGTDWKQITETAKRDAELDVAKEAPQTAPTSVPKEVADSRWGRLVKGLTENPDLLSYKVKVNGYKYSWALIPLSLPFMWLIFIRRRDVHMYDHAIFVTYSITFMMLLITAVSLVGGLFLPSRYLSPVVQGGAVIHMYRQLRGAYGLSVGGALLREIPLLLSAGAVLLIFVVALVLLGALD